MDVDPVLSENSADGVSCRSIPGGPTSTIVLGRDSAATQGWYDGLLGSVVLYPYALAADQLANHVAQRTLTASGGGQLSYALSANTTGAARTGTLTVAGISMPVDQAATGGVAIAGSVAPPPNAAGWNNTVVTVTFTCAGSGTIACASPVTVSQDGEVDVRGWA